MLISKSYSFSLLVLLILHNQRFFFVVALGFLVLVPLLVPFLALFGTALLAQVVSFLDQQAEDGN